jgi:hypothetical protein
MQLAKIHGFAVIVLGVLLLGLQTMLYLTPKQVVSGPPKPTAKVEHETYPAPGILGLVSLAAGAAIFATRRRADQSEAKDVK